MKKRIFILLAVAIVLVGGWKLVESNWFVESVIIPTAQKNMANRFQNGDSVRIYSAQIDSMWKVGIDKVVLIPSDPSAVDLARVEERFGLEQGKPTSFIIAADMNKVSAYNKVFHLPLLQSANCGTDYLFLNKDDQRILVADIRKEQSADRSCYILSIEKVSAK